MNDVGISSDDVIAAQVGIARRKRVRASSKIRKLEEAYLNASAGEERQSTFDLVQRAILQVMDILEQEGGGPSRMKDLIDVLHEMGMVHPVVCLRYMVGLGSLSHPEGDDDLIQVRGFVSSHHKILT
ncbi:MAG: hypothetical protein WD883_02030 [Candidatus Colwellbacteria bacterium]